VALALCIPQVRTRVHDSMWPPANVRLALLPATGSDSSLRLAGGILQDASERISHLKSGSHLVEVIAPLEARRIQARTPEEAGRAHATHAFQTSIRQDGSDLVVEAYLVDLKTGVRIGRLSNRYAPATFGAIPNAIAGTISAGLGLQGTRNSEKLLAGATSPYDKGLQELLQGEPNVDAASSLFEESAKLDPGSPLPLAALVEAEVKGFERSKNSSYLGRAQADLLAAKKLNPDSLSVHFAAGRLHEVTGEYEKALDEYQRAGELEPRSTQALIRVARMYDKLGAPDKAIAAYQAAIDLDPAFYKPYQHLGDFFYSRGRYAEAAAEFQKVIERSPKAYLAYANLSDSLQFIGKNREAEEALATSLKIKETARALNDMGALLASERRDTEAIAYLDRCVTLDSRNYFYFLNLADCNRRLGHRKTAREQYARGMDLTLADWRENPRDGRARAALAYFAAQLGQKERAADETRQALQLSAGDNNVIYLAVMTYVTLGQRDRALTSLSEGTPQLLRGLIREPDLADFLRDPRFIELLAVKNKGEQGNAQKN